MMASIALNGAKKGKNGEKVTELGWSRAKKPRANVQKWTEWCKGGDNCAKKCKKRREFGEICAKKVRRCFESAAKWCKKRQNLHESWKQSCKCG